MLRFELGQLSMREKIHVKKLNFIYHLKNLNSESLGHEFYTLQVRHRFPGLVNECRSLLKHYQLPDIIDGNHVFTKNSWKVLVKKSVKKKSEDLIKKEISSYSKLSKSELKSDELEMKNYVKSMSLRNTRTMFRIRSQMTDVKSKIKCKILK